MLRAMFGTLLGSGKVMPHGMAHVHAAKVAEESLHGQSSVWPITCLSFSIPADGLPCAIDWATAPRLQV